MTSGQNLWSGDKSICGSSEKLWSTSPAESFILTKRKFWQQTICFSGDKTRNFIWSPLWDKNNIQSCFCTRNKNLKVSKITTVTTYYCSVSTLTVALISWWCSLLSYCQTAIELMAHLSINQLKPVWLQQSGLRLWGERRGMKKISGGMVGYSH